jgi:hypothetical protein
MDGAEVILVSGESKISFDTGDAQTIVIGI